MSLSPAQVRFLAETHLFDDAMREVIAILNDFAPLLWHVSLAKQRDRSRLVTRRKQRNRW